MTPSAILESALYVADLDAAEAFYRDVLGLASVGKVPGRHVFFRCGAGILLLFNPAETVKPPPADSRLPVPPHGATGEGHLCLAATEEEIDRWKAHLASHGVVVESELAWPGGGRSIYFRDPSGNSLEFANPAIWSL